MTVPTTDNQVQEKSNQKEYNFRALEQQLQQERAARIQAEREAEELKQRQSHSQSSSHDDEDDDQPYVDRKKLSKTMDKFGQNTQSMIDKGMETAKQRAKEELRQEMWLESNPDFYDVLQNAEKFAQRAPKLAETILKMPDNFDRQKLVYQNIKEFGLDKPEQKQPSIQEKIDSNRKGPFYQPSQLGTAPYNSQGGDYSQGGQKNAYEKMKQLQAQLRI